MSMHILIAIPSDIFRKGLEAVFSGDRHVSKVSEVATSEELIEYLASHSPDLVIVHQSLSTAFNILPRDHFIILTTQPDKNVLVNAYDYGARGYFLESVSTDILLLTLNLKERGFLLDPKLTSWIIKYISGNVLAQVDTEVLTSREKQVFDLRIHGFTNKVIAQQLSIAPSTVKKHLENISRKLGKKIM